VSESEQRFVPFTASETLRQPQNGLRISVSQQAAREGSFNLPSFTQVSSNRHPCSPLNRLFKSSTLCVGASRCTARADQPPRTPRLTVSPLSRPILPPLVTHPFRDVSLRFPCHRITAGGCNRGIPQPRQTEAKGDTPALPIPQRTEDRADREAAVAPLRLVKGGLPIMSKRGPDAGAVGGARPDAPGPVGVGPQHARGDGGSAGPRERLHGEGDPKGGTPFELVATMCSSTRRRRPPGVHPSSTSNGERFRSTTESAVNRLCRCGPGPQRDGMAPSQGSSSPGWHKIREENRWPSRTLSGVSYARRTPLR